MKFWQSRLRAEELKIPGYSLMGKTQLETAIHQKEQQIFQEANPQPKALSTANREGKQ